MADTRKEIDKAVDKGICCTGIKFIKRQENKTHVYEGALSHRCRGHLWEFIRKARVRLSRVDSLEGARLTASFKSESLSNEIFTIEATEKCLKILLPGIGGLS